MEAINLAEQDGLPTADWADIVNRLDAGSHPDSGALNARTTWFTTINADGSPHVTGVGALWVDGTFWFETGKNTRKARNVARDPRCSMAVSVQNADVVFEGVAERVTDPADIARLAEAWADSGWPAELDESGTGLTAPFNAPTLGPPPWPVYRIKLRSATVVGQNQLGSLTRFRF